MENGGGAGTQGSHFEKTMFGNDLMTARDIFTDASFSFFNIALLRDTGWYSEVN